MTICSGSGRLTERTGKVEMNDLREAEKKTARSSWRSSEHRRAFASSLTRSSRRRRRFHPRAWTGSAPSSTISPFGRCSSARSKLTAPARCTSCTGSRRVERRRCCCSITSSRARPARPAKWRRRGRSPPKIRVVSERERRGDAPGDLILEPNERVLLATRPLFLWEPLVILLVLLLIARSTRPIRRRRCSPERCSCRARAEIGSWFGDPWPEVVRPHRPRVIESWGVFTEIRPRCSRPRAGRESRRPFPLSLVRDYASCTWSRPVSTRRADLERPAELSMTNASAFLPRAHRRADAELTGTVSRRIAIAELTVPASASMSSATAGILRPRRRSSRT